MIYYMLGRRRNDLLRTIVLVGVNEGVRSFDSCTV